MKLYFLRHAIAVQRGTPGYDDDSFRPLTDMGKKKLHLVCEGLHHLEPDWDVIITSPYLRAKETGKIVAQYFNLTHRVREHKSLTPQTKTEDLNQYLKTLLPLRSILLVGHEPALSRHISNYVFGSEYGHIQMKKSGMACVEFSENVDISLGTLEWLMSPSQMQRLGRKRK